jgi:ABC-2 type transport system permease protein
MSQISHILRYKALAGLKMKVDFRWHTLVKNFSSLLVFGGFAVGAYFFTSAVTAYLIEEAKIGSFLLHRFLSMFLFVFFMTICIGNILVSYSTLFRSPEVRFYFTLPVAYYKIFLIKFLDNFFYSSTTFFLMGSAVLAGYGSYFGYPWYIYPGIVFLVFIPFMFLAACIAVIILFGVMRLASFVSVPKIIGSFAVGYLAVIYLFFTSVSPGTLVNNVLAQYPNIDRYFTGFDPWFLRFLPSHWVSELMYWLSHGHYSAVFWNFMLLSITTAGFFIAAVLIGRKQYYKSWLVSMDIKDRTRKNNRSFLPRAVNIQDSGVFDRQTGVLLKRDILRFFREPGQWLHFSIMVILVIVFIISVRGMQVEFRDPFLMLIVFLVIYLFNAFLISAMSLRFVYPMISLEGEALWAVRSAPLNVRKIYLLKIVTAISVLLLFAQLLTIITTASVYKNPYLLAFSMGGQFVVVLTLVSMNLGLGSYFATYFEKNPIRIASSQGASLTFLLSFLYLLFVLAVFTPSLSRFFDDALRGTEHTITHMFFSLAIVTCFSTAIIIITSAMGYKALKRDV